MVHSSTIGVGVTRFSAEVREEWSDRMKRSGLTNATPIVMTVTDGEPQSEVEFLGICDDVQTSSPVYF